MFPFLYNSLMQIGLVDMPVVAAALADIGHTVKNGTLASRD